MAAHGINLAEEGHIVHVYPSADPAGVVAGDVFSMENAGHVTIMILKGAGSAATVTIEECTGFGGAGNTAIGFDYYLESSAAGDTLATKATAGTGGVAFGAISGVMMIIELDASQLSDGSGFVLVNMDSVGASQVCIAAVLSGWRYQEDQGQSAII